MRRAPHQQSFPLLARYWPAAGPLLTPGPAAVFVSASALAEFLANDGDPGDCDRHLDAGGYAPGGADLETRLANSPVGEAHRNGNAVLAEAKRQIQADLVVIDRDAHALGVHQHLTAHAVVRGFREAVNAALSEIALRRVDGVLNGLVAELIVLRHVFLPLNFTAGQSLGAV